MDEKGLTLIELLITISIIAILAASIVPVSRLSVKRGNEVELKRNLRVIRVALDNYKKAWDEGKIKKSVGESGYPATLQVLVEGVDDVSSVEGGRKLKFLRRIPRDPMNRDEFLGDSEVWGLRSYKSDADSPAEGDDVFDIYSKSEEVAINGTQYNKW
ncbi:Predicted secretion system W protein GspG-like [hydrothermal vent metagenome]|uniref:Predicted secretion system W protein GspG-like n=1 Tax=hydrothermal vent metagenome TaxID=652676 RepID=A0A3B0QR28_9ZZZZ